MSALVLFGWGLVGWCGTGPKPRPSPKQIISGVIGGLVGGGLVYFALGLSGALGSMDFVATAIGAYAGGRVLSDIAELVLGKGA
jgi:hypothetical protein